MLFHVHLKGGSSNARSLLLFGGKFIYNLILNFIFKEKLRVKMITTLGVLIGEAVVASNQQTFI